MKLTRKLTEKQAKAIDYLTNKNPNATPLDVARAIGASTSHGNEYAFIGRLIENGACRLVPTSEAKEDAQRKLRQDNQTGV